MERHGAPIYLADYRHGVKTGISAGATLPGLVPPWDEYEAMCQANYTEETWQAAPWRARARAVAAMRIRQWIALHTEDARQAAMQAQHAQAQHAAQGRK